MGYNEGRGGWMRRRGTGVGGTYRPGKAWGRMLASPAPQAAPFDAVAATLSHSLCFQSFRTSNLTNKSTTNAPIKRTGVHTSDAASNSRNCDSKSSRSSSKLPQLVVLSIRHKVSTSRPSAAAGTPRPWRSPTEHEAKASPAARCPAKRSAGAAKADWRSCSPSSAPA